MHLLLSNLFFENIFLKVIEHVSRGFVATNHKGKPPVGSLGSTHAQFFAVFPHHLRKMAGITLETVSIKSIILDLSVPHVGGFFASCIELPGKHGNVFPSPLAFDLRSMLQAMPACQLFSPGLCVSCNLSRPFQRWHAVLGAILVVGFKGLLCKWAGGAWAFRT